MRKSALVALTVMALLAATVPNPLASAAVPTDTAELREAVTPDGVFEHVEAFQAIADANDDTRAAASPGYVASADYVSGLLDAAGYDVERQFFDFPFFHLISSSFSQTAPVARTFAPYDLSTGTGDYDVMTYSGSGSTDDTLVVPTTDVIIPAAADADTSNSGCEASDFPAAVDGNVALIQRGSCSFAQKAANAQAAGAVAALIFNEGQPGRDSVLLGTLGGPGIDIPVLGIGYGLGVELYEAAAARVSLDVQTESEIRTTSNVIADTAAGREDRTVVVGAHLDSVPEGPGINDNGSGSATLLEIALQMAALEIEPTNRVRFAFWGAEEFGLLGSEYYVSQLTKRQIKDIAVNLNFDMVASPNYVRFVYDGDGSDTPLAGPTGSATVEDVFVDYFSSQGLASEPTEFSGRSDYGPFIDVGIPAGGLFTGAEGIKTEQEAAIYGGVAGEAYDPCYHQACDNLHVEPYVVPAVEDAYGDDVLVGNVNMMALDEMADATAHATLTFAMTTSAVPGTAKGNGKGTDASAQTYKGHEARR